MKCKNTILNEMVQNTAEVMRNKIEETQCIIDQLADANLALLAERPYAHMEKVHTNVDRMIALIKFNDRTKAAVEVMEEYGGTWA